MDDLIRMIHKHSVLHKLYYKWCEYGDFKVSCLIFLVCNEIIVRTENEFIPSIVAGRRRRWWQRWRRRGRQRPATRTIFSRREIYAARAIRYDDGSICAWRLLITFLSLKGITTRQRVTSLTRLKARNWFSSGANPTRRDRVHSDEKEGWLLAPVHRRLLNQSDMAFGMHRPPRLPLTTSVL